VQRHWRGLVSSWGTEYGFRALIGTGFWTACRQSFTRAFSTVCH
jgi:hypothetical protein